LAEASSAVSDAATADTPVQASSGPPKPPKIADAVGAVAEKVKADPAPAASLAQHVAASAGALETEPTADISPAAMEKATAKALAGLPKLSGTMHTVSQEMKFPNPSSGPPPEYVVSKIEDKVQQRAPQVANKVLKLANDAYTHVDFHTLTDKIVSLASSGAEVGKWPGANKYGFAPDANHFCLFAVPVLKGAPGAFKAAAAASPVGLPSDFKGPSGEPVVKPLAPGAKETTVKASAGGGMPAPIDGGPADVLNSVLAKASGALPPRDGSAAPPLPAFNPDGLASVAAAVGGPSLAVNQGASGALAKGATSPVPTPEIRTFTSEGKEWACTPYAPGSTADPTATALAAGAGKPAAGKAASSASSGRALLAEKAAAPAAAPATKKAAAVPAAAAAAPKAAVAPKAAPAAKAAAAPAAAPAAKKAAAPITATTSTPKAPPPKPSLDDTINPAGAKIIDLGAPSAAGAAGAPASAPQLVNPITGENKFADSDELTTAVTAQAAGSYERLLAKVKAGEGGEWAAEAAADLASRGVISAADAADPAKLAAAQKAGNKTLAETLSTAGEARRPPLVTFDPQTGVARIHPPKSALDALGAKFDDIVRGQTGNAFFDCIGVKDAPSGKQFVETAASDAEKLATRFVSFVKDNKGQGIPVPTGFSVKNPFKPNAPPINVQFSQASPYLTLPNGQEVTPTTNPFKAVQSFLATKPPKPGHGPLGSWATQPPRHAGNNAAFGGHDWKAESERAASDADALAAAAQTAAANAAAAAAAAAQLPVGADGTPTVPGVAYDGYLSDCSLVVGGLPRGDGTFDKVDGFASTVRGGHWGVPASVLAAHPGSAAYIIPAARDGKFGRVAGPDTDAGFCFDRATLLPAFNPLATPLPASAEAVATGVAAASPLSTVLVFGAAAGLTGETLKAALSLPDAIDIPAYDALAAVRAGGAGAADALAVLRANAQVANTVTVGAGLLSGDSAAYAAVAVSVYQAIAEAAAGRQVAAAVAVAPAAPAPASEGGQRRRLAQDAAAAAAPADAAAAAAPAAEEPAPTRRGPRGPRPPPPLRRPGAPAEEAPDASSIPAPGGKVDLTDSAVLGAILQRAQALAATSPALAAAPGGGGAAAPPAPADPAVALAVSGAIASLNREAAAATNPMDVAKTTFVAQSQLSPAVARLAAGTVPADAFAAAASDEGLRASLAGASLPGTLVAGPKPKPGSAKGAGKGLSKGAAIAVGVLVPLAVLVAAIVGGLALARRRRAAAARTPVGTGRTGGLIAR